MRRHYDARGEWMHPQPHKGTTVTIHFTPRHQTLRIRFKPLFVSFLYALLSSFHPTSSAHADAYRSFTEDLALGSSGAEVTFLQEILCELPKTFAPCPPSGTFDAQTRDAVIRLQRDVGITDAALMGSIQGATRTYLNAYLEDRNGSAFNAPVVSAQESYRAAQTARTASDLEAVLESRRAAMDALLTMNHEKARQFVLPKKIRGRLPKHLRSLVEEDRKRIKGTVLEFATHSSTPPYAETIHQYVRTKRGELYLVPGGDDRLAAGAYVSARGLKLGNQFLPGGDQGTSTKPGDVRVLRAPVAVTTEPVERLGAILLEFPDLPHTEPRSAVAQELQAIDTYYQVGSYGRTRVDIQTTDWKMSTRSYLDLRCDLGGGIREALQRAAGEIDFASKTVIIIVVPSIINYPPFQCPKGSSGLGGAFVGPVQLDLPDGQRLDAVGLGFLSDHMVTDPAKPRVQLHEFTHTRGVPHALALICPERSIEADVKQAGCQPANEPFDFMGASRQGEINVIYKAGLGWLGGSNRVQEVTATGTYRVDPLEQSGGVAGVKALKLSRTDTESFWLEYRRPIGYDAGVNPNHIDGALIRAVLPSLSNQTYLLAGIPGVATIENYAFKLGKTFYDPRSQWAITPTAVDATGLTVSVDSMPPFSCDPAVSNTLPGQSVTLTATGVARPIVWSAPGATVTSGAGSSFTTAYNSPGTYIVTYQFVNSVVKASCTVNVLPPPSATFRLTGSGSFDQVTLAAGQSTTVTWSSSNATECHLSYQTGPNGQHVQRYGLSGAVTFPSWSQPSGVVLACFDTINFPEQGAVAAMWGKINVKSAETPPSPAGDNATCGFITTRPSPRSINYHPYLDTLHFHEQEARRVQVVFFNTGTTTWQTDASPYRALLTGSDWFPDSVGLGRKTVRPGEYVVLSRDVEYEGQFPPWWDILAGSMTWRMSANGIPFGQSCSTKFFISEHP